MAIPKLDTQLISYSANFSAVLSADPEKYLQTEARAAAVAAAHAAYAAAQTALLADRASGIFSQPATAQRNALKGELLRLIRPIYAMVQASVEISAADKIALGVHVKAVHPSAPPEITTRPVVTVADRIGNAVTVRIGDGSASRRKPDGVDQILLFTQVAQTPSADPAAWRCVEVTGKTTARVPFSPMLPPGTQVWITAAYRNTTGTGPSSNPITTTLVGGAAALPLAA